PITRELREQLASLRKQLADESRFAVRDGTHTGRVVSRASGNQSLDAVKHDWNASPFEQLEHVSSSSSRGNRNRRLAIRLVVECRVSLVVQQQLDILQIIVAAQRLVERCVMPMRHSIGI